MNMRAISGVVAVCLAGLVTASCQAPIPIIDPRPDIELTWSEAIVALPPLRGGQKTLVARLGDGSVRGRLKSLPRGSRLPVVLYAHGCTGIGDKQFMKMLTRAGYAVIAPDSMARRYRPLQCDSETKTGGFNRFVYDFRLTEISFALDRMARLRWADLNNMFLLGISEGGVAAALYRGDEFRARVIAQWTCTGAPIVHGIHAPPSEPILAIVRGDDPWYRKNHQQGDCGAHMLSRPGSRSIVLNNGSEHNVLADRQVLRAIVDFLDANRQAGR